MRVGGADDRFTAALLDQVGVAVVAADLDLCITQWNREAEQLLGWTPREAASRALLDLIVAPEDRRTASELIADAHAGQPWEGDFPLRAKAGRRLLCRIRISAVRDAVGAPLGVCAVVVDITERIRAQENARLASERLSLLGRASELLDATLDLDATLTALVELTVPAVADHCLLDLLDDQGNLRRAATAHAPDSAPPAADAMRPGTLVQYQPDHPVYTALATRRPVLLSAIPRERAGAVAPTPALAAHAQRIGVSAQITVPLAARGHLLGALTLFASVSGRHYDAEDLTLAEQLAARAAVALDNARLYRHSRQIAETLQRSLLPKLPDHAGDLVLASYYAPGTADTDAGGDFLDVIELPAGRFALVTGDVMGRGVGAAAVMGQVRATVRAYAALDLPPEQLLTHLDALVAGLPGEQLATCVYLVYEPGSHRATVALAGHLPPLLVHDGAVRPLELDPGQPLGYGAGAFRQQDIELAPGDVLAMFTDGLVETPQRDLDTGTGQLAELLVERGGDLVEPGDHVAAQCERIVRVMAPAGGFDDDVAVLLAQLPADTTARTALELALPTEPSVQAARTLAQSAVTEWGRPELAERVRLVVSELVTNAIRHARPPLVLRLRHFDGVVYVEVSDRDSRLPRLRHADDDDEGGRGLLLIDTVSSQWGARPLTTGKVVWASVH